MIYSCCCLLMARKNTGLAFCICLSFEWAFALLPYLALREPNTEFSGKRMRFSNSCLTGVALTIGAVILVAYGLEWRGNFVQQWQTKLHPCHELGFLPTLPIVSRALRDDMTRRGLKIPVVLAEH